MAEQSGVLTRTVCPTERPCIPFRIADGGNAFGTAKRTNPALISLGPLFRKVSGNG